MIIVFFIFQGIALFSLAFFCWMWSGRNTAWLQGRGRGWSALIFGLGFTFFQGVALASLVFTAGTQDEPFVDSDLLRLFTVALWFLGSAWMLIGLTFGWPLFMLPGWIRERLRAGDPVQTAHPIPEVQHLMTKPQNKKLLSSTYGASHVPENPAQPSGQPPFELPMTFRIGTGGWWAGAVIAGISAAILTFALIGFPAQMFEGTGWRMGVFRILAVIGVPIAAFCTYYYVRGALHPEHVTISEDGVATRSWRLAWDEIQEVLVTGDPGSHKGQVQLRVNNDAFSREGANNRWFSGRPMRLGGAVSKQPVIKIQPGTQALPMHVAEGLEHMRNRNSPSNRAAPLQNAPQSSE